MKGRLRKRVWYFKRTAADHFTSVTFRVLTITLAIVIGTVDAWTIMRADSSVSGASPAAQVQVPPPKQLSSTFAAIVKQIAPAVVSINTETYQKTRTPRQHRSNPNNPPGEDQQDQFQDFFDFFFRGPFFGAPFDQLPEMGPREERSMGSGVVLDSRGYIVTNQHVVEGATRVRVHLKDDPPGEQYEAKVIGTDKETDLAVIKIEPKGALRAAKIGNSDSLQTGDWVLAIGNPFGLEATVTSGIISAKARNIVPGRQFQSFIQTDAAISPGNSGGPLVNMDGEVVGINTAIFTRGFSSGYMGVGFAMPSNTMARCTTN
jgi:serine protease Do